jgi:hypothetical protein
VDFHYYIDGAMESEQTANTFVATAGQNANQADCNLMVDYQMENSSGTPGPSYTTYTYVSNIVVKRLNVSGVGSGPVANGAYRLVAQNSGDALDVGNQYTTNNSPLDQWPYNAGLNQQWTITHLGGNQYSIFGRQSGRALQVAGAATTNGAKVNIMDYTNGNNQQWTLVANSSGYYSLINIGSGKMMEVSNNSTNNLAPIDQWSSANTTFPLINTASLLGTNIALRGLTGVPGIAYSLLTSTDITVPVSNWTSVATVTFDKNGNFASTNGIAPGSPQQFFRLQLQSTNGSANQQWSFQSP